MSSIRLTSGLVMLLSLMAVCCQAYFIRRMEPSHEDKSQDFPISFSLNDEQDAEDRMEVLQKYLSDLETRKVMSHYPFAVPYNDWRAYGSVMGVRPNTAVKRGRLDTLLAKLQRLAGGRDGSDRVNFMRFGPGRR